MRSARVGKRGAIVVPAELRKRFGIEEGSIVIAEEKEDGILIRPAMVVPVERYTPERKAEFLLTAGCQMIGKREEYRNALYAHSPSSIACGALRQVLSAPKPGRRRPAQALDPHGTVRRATWKLHHWPRNRLVVKWTAVAHRRQPNGR